MDDGLGEMFTPEILLASQLLPQPRRNTPELALILAVLDDAMLRLSRVRDGHKPKARKEAHELYAWFNGAAAAITFEMACTVLGRPPSAVRAAIFGRAAPVTRGRTHRHTVRQGSPLTTPP